MPSPKMGQERKHSNHLSLLRKMMADDLPDRIGQAQSLSSVYELLLSHPGVGRFLAFQYAIDLNYSAMLDFDEAEFVVAGPGALDGISKCFSCTAGWSPEQIIMWVTERQDREFASRGDRVLWPGGSPAQADRLPEPVLRDFQICSDGSSIGSRRFRAHAYQAIIQAFDEAAAQAVLPVEIGGSTASRHALRLQPSLAFAQPSGRRRRKRR